MLRPMSARQKGRNSEEARRSPLHFLPHLFFILAVATSLAHFRTQIDSNDEGIAAMGAWRVLQGEAPYRDFFAIETPLSFYVVAPAYALFGVSFETGRAVAQLLMIGIVAFVFRLGKRWIPSPLFAAVPLAFLCQAGVGIFPIASHHWFANLFALAALWFAAREGWWGAGAALALAFASLQGQGLWMILGMTVVASTAPPREERGRAVLRLLGGLAAAGLPLALLVVLRAGWAAPWHDLVVFPLTSYRATEGNAPGLLQPFVEIAAQWQTGAWRRATLFTTAATITSLSLIAAPLASPFLLLFARRRGAPIGSVALLLAGCAGFVLTAFHRWSPINIQWAAAPPALALGLWLWTEKKAAPERRWPTVVAGVLLCSFAVFPVSRIADAGDHRLRFAL